MVPLNRLRSPLPPIYPPKKPAAVRHLGRSRNQLGRYGVAAQALKGSTPHPFRPGHDPQRKGSLLWPT